MRPPLFKGTNYSYWRTRMKLFIQANDYEVWRILTNGSSIPIKRVKGVIISKEEIECDENDINKVQLNAKTMHTLFCVLVPMSTIESPCMTMQKKYETNLKSPMKGQQNRKNELRKCLIASLRLSTVSKFLGRHPNKEMVKKMLNSLLTSWEPRVTVIEELKDLNSLSLDELIGSLLTYEMKINYNAKETK
ncbi:hypothetical protein PVK06_005121 [Gossypium arboreum]|uniref:DUF4219 domain-containing protein/UBN2 domain-containing protein n=1 Tax=Gossypium arboreum TaxID=29729 RepID=A0ABR0QUU8_GOSAR|nr:hypothetical protein PVK06_005121 [Gossypium arboreum]